MADDDIDENGDEPVTEGPTRPRGEGVRIIGAEEAAAALESGSASRRQPEDAPRYGDRPAPPDTSRVRGIPNDVTDELTARTRPSPWGPRDQDDDEAHESDVSSTQPLPLRPESPRIDSPRADEGRQDRPESGARGGQEPGPSGPPSGGNPTLPHWTEPPTGEVPRILPGAGDDTDEPVAGGGPERTSPRWRDQDSDWATADFDDVSNLADEPADVDDQAGIDPFEFAPDEPVPAPGPVPVRTRMRPPPSGGPEGYHPQGTDSEGAVGPDRPVGTAIATGVIVAVVALLLFRAGPGPTLVLAVAIVGFAVVELFAVLRKAGYRPATLLGITATVSVMLAAYAKGETAIPLVLALTMICSLLWFMFGVVRARPTINVGMTLLGVIWVGFLGSFAALLLRAPDREGIAFLLGAVLATVAYDVGGLFIGSRSGRTPLAPGISPNKTWEGVMGGAGAALAVSLLITARVHPWDFGSAAALGIVVAFMAPLGDLSQSLIKRDLGLKDMGTLLPGHGGVMDRFDALLFVLPATYYLVRLLQLA